ncbi:hypothetical protein V6R21_22025 [Limibacter armeniacum]|uniref:hypothetical protein n=1 Tax=Limibacter armeniacum TaxID=466084 RepID=UPI002FE68831
MKNRGDIQVTDKLYQHYFRTSAEKAPEGFSENVVQKVRAQEQSKVLEVKPIFGNHLKWFLLFLAVVMGISTIWIAPSNDHYLILMMGERFSEILKDMVFYFKPSHEMSLLIAVAGVGWWILVLFDKWLLKNLSKR